MHVVEEHSVGEPTDALWYICHTLQELTAATAAGEEVPLDPKNKVALVTGGGTGLGKEISLKLAAAGALVAVNYSRSAEEAAETVSEIESDGGKAMSVKADVSVSSDVRRMVDEVVEQFGGIDILINNAGTTVFVPFSDLDGMKEEDWDNIMAVNLRGPFLCSQNRCTYYERSRGRKDNKRDFYRRHQAWWKLHRLLSIESGRRYAGSMLGGSARAGDPGQQCGPGSVGYSLGQEVGRKSDK